MCVYVCYNGCVLVFYQELDQTVITMLSKTADTNHFIRDEAVKTLEAMIENVPPQKALSVLITNGTGYDCDSLLVYRPHYWWHSKLCTCLYFYCVILLSTCLLYTSDAADE